MHQQELSLSGELTFYGIKQVRSSFLNEIKISKSKALLVNLKGVSRTDSSGLALMLEGLKVAQKKGLAIRYSALPDPVVKLAKLYGLEDILCSS